MARTRTFDADTVIERAMNVFRAKGYFGTSIQNLVEKTGLLKGSLYSAFESKENLFRLALQHYATQIRRDYIRDEAPLDYLRDHFRRIVNESSGSAPRHGCFITNTCMELSNSDLTELSKQAESMFKESEKNYVKALRIARDRGELPSNTDVDPLAHRLIAAAFAIRQIARFRSDRKLFTSIANGVLKELEIEV